MNMKKIFNVERIYLLKLRCYASMIDLFFIQAYKNSLRILHINITFKDFAFFISRAFELFTRKK